MIAPISLYTGASCLLAAHGPYAINGDGFGSIGLPEDVAKRNASIPICGKSVRTSSLLGRETATLDCVQNRHGMDERFWKLRVERCICPKNE